MAILKKNLITKNKWNIFFTKLKQNLSVVGILFSHISGKPRRFLNADHNNYIESLYTSFSFCFGQNDDGDNYVDIISYTLSSLGHCDLVQISYKPYEMIASQGIYLTGLLLCLDLVYSIIITFYR